jgi:hypothetical protein
VVIAADEEGGLRVVAAAPGHGLLWRLVEVAVEAAAAAADMADKARSPRRVKESRAAVRTKRGNDGRSRGTGGGDALVLTDAIVAWIRAVEPGAWEQWQKSGRVIPGLYGDVWVVATQNKTTEDWSSSPRPPAEAGEEKEGLRGTVQLELV